MLKSRLVNDQLQFNVVNNLEMVVALQNGEADYLMGGLPPNP